jgi:ABC-type Mn2+/Zn2+ transport system ATPase subunit
MLLNPLNTVQGFYVYEGLYTAIHLIVGYLLKEELINVSELMLFSRTLELATDTALFKNKNSAAFKKIESSCNKIEVLREFLDNINNSFDKINYTIDGSSSKLIIDGLDFTRSSDNLKKAHLKIDHLEFVKGMIYAVTGANGSGKSSITTLLKYLIDGTNDPSFKIISGDIIFPSKNIGFIPQRDYVARDINNIFDMIIYPLQAEDFSQEQTQVYEAKSIRYINELEIFNSYKNSTISDLYHIKNDLRDLSGGQFKKIFLIKHLIECPEIFIGDEFHSPLDARARNISMDIISSSCLKDSIVIFVRHLDTKNGTSCVTEPFFDYEAHVQNETIVIGKVGDTCFH